MSQSKNSNETQPIAKKRNGRGRTSAHIVPFIVSICHTIRMQLNKNSKVIIISTIIHCNNDTIWIFYACAEYYSQIRHRMEFNFDIICCFNKYALNGRHSKFYSNHCVPFWLTFAHFARYVIFRAPRKSFIHRITKVLQR